MPVASLLPAAELSPEQVLDSSAHHISTLVLITYSSVLERAGTSGDELNHRLSRLSSWVLDAGLVLHEAHPQARIVIAGERTFAGWPSTSRMMADQAAARGVNRSQLHALVDDNGLPHTPAQMAKLADHRMPRGILAVGMGYHLDRVNSHAKSYNLAMGRVPAEDILRASGFQGILPDPAVLRYFSRREAPVRYWSKLDRRGKALRLISLGLGTRVQDVLVDPVTSQQKPVDTTSRAVLLELGL